MADQFGPHHPRHGPRLDQIQGLGRGGFARQIREVGLRGPDGRPSAAGSFVGAPAAVPAPAPAGGVMARRGRVPVVKGRDFAAERDALWARAVGEAEELVRGAVGALGPGEVRRTAERVVRAVRVGRKVGRPKFEGVRPWEAEGISRAAWFRRKKEGGG